MNATYVPGTQDIANGTVTLVLTTDSVSNCYPGTDTLLVTITPAPVVNAGSNIYLCIGASAHLNGSVSGGNGTGIWQTAGDGTFTPGDSALNATYIPGSGDLTSGTVLLTLTSTHNGGCIAGSDDVLVTITDYPVVSAGSDLAICSNDSAALSGNVSGSTTTGYWATNGGGTFSPDSSYLNAYYLPDSADIANGSVTLYLTSSLACAVTDSLVLTIIPAPVADAGNNQVICQGVVDVSLNGSVSNASSFEWSSTGTGTFSPDNTTLNATYTLSSADSLAGSVILILAATGDPLCQITYDSLTVTTAGNIQLNAGNDTSICASADIFLNGYGNAGTLYWTTSGTGTFLPDSSDLMAQYLFSDADTTAGSVVLVLNSQTSCGLYTDSMTVTFTPVPYVDAGSDFTMCDNAEFIELTGIVSAGANTGVWTTDGTGYFDPHDSLLTVLYYPSAADLQQSTITFWLTSTHSNGCIEITDSVIATIEPSPVVNAGEDKTVCEGNNAVLDGQISGTPGTGSWQTTGDGTFSPSPAALNASYIPGSGDLTAGTVILILSSDITANCSSVSDSLVITFITPGTAAELIPLDSLCYGDSLFIIPTIQGDTGTFAWSSSGTGTFWPDTSTALPVYIPGEEDLTSGSVLIFMHYTYACGSKDDTLTLNINPIPEAWFTYRANCDNMNVMFIDSTQISNGSIVTWEWDFGDGTNGNTATVNHPYLLPGTHQVTLAVQSASGCTDTISRPVQVFEPMLTDFSVSDSTPAPGTLVNFNNESVNALSYFWTFGDNSGTSAEENPSYTYNTPGTYTVWLHTEGENNCSDSAMVNIVINFAGYAVPTAFSPNGDGLNDFFFIRGGPFTEYELRVFNSWGQQVFLSAEQQVQWDGTFKGKELQEGVYVVVFRGKLTDGTELEFTGDITLVR